MNNQRVLSSELMDDPELDPLMHRAALRGLARLNALSMAWRPIAAKISNSKILMREFTLLDVATGSGDVALKIAIQLRIEGFEPNIVLTDISNIALGEAEQRFRDQGFQVHVLARDATSEALPDCDVAICSLFLHHLADSKTARVIDAMSQAARHLCIIADLERTFLGSLLARVVPRFVTRSPVVHTDAVLSARAAYTLNELKGITRGIGIQEYHLERIYPSRILLSWTASGTPKPE